jgi:hypothetical protein
MAVKIDTDSYFEDFSGGQGGGAGAYKTYSDDMDSNFLALRLAINANADSLDAVGGSNAVLGKDLMVVDDADGPIDVSDSGFIGSHSYAASITGGGASLTLQSGPIMINGIRGALLIDAVLPYTGGASTIYVAVDANGIPSLSTLAVQKVLDIYTAVWDGAAFTSFTRLVNVLMDGDQYQRMLTPSGTGTSFPTKVYDSFAKRVEAIERLISGRNTDVDGDALGPIIAPGGSAGTPGLTFGNGAGVTDGNTGFYWSTDDTVSYSAGGTKRLEFGLDGIGAQPGSVGSPAFYWTADKNSGFYWIVADHFGVSAGGVLAMSWLKTGSVSQAFLSPTGTVLLPSLSTAADPNTGVRMPGGDIIEFISNAIVAATVNANQTISSVTQHRVRATASAFTIGQAALTNIDFDTEAYDVGGLMEQVTNKDRCTIVTDGLYEIVGVIQFDESTAAAGGVANVGDFRHGAITINGALTGPTGQDRRSPTASGDTFMTIPEKLFLSAGAIVRVQGAHDNGGDMDVNATISVSKIW